VAFGFLAGLTACLIPHFDDHHHHHHGGGPPTVTHAAHACATSAVPSEDQNGSPRPLLASSLDVTQNLLYEGVPLAPPFPPPRV
jgi:hypothetical protein